MFIRKNHDSLFYTLYWIFCFSSSLAWNAHSFTDSDLSPTCTLRFTYVINTAEITLVISNMLMLIFDVDDIPYVLLGSWKGLWYYFVILLCDFYLVISQLNKLGELTNQVISPNSLYKSIAKPFMLVELSFRFRFCFKFVHHCLQTHLVLGSCR